jgi:glycosyltransferase involved in cell wall biosynthesis
MKDHNYRRYKIAHIGQSIGGVDTYIRLLVAHLNVNNFKQIILHGKNENEANFKDKSGKAIKEFSISLIRSVNPIVDTLALLQAIKIIRKEQPDLIHCHSSKGGMIGRIAGYILNIPSLYTPNAFSYLSAKNKVKRILFLTYERAFKNLNTTLLACSKSESIRGLSEVNYPQAEVVIWQNSIEAIKCHKTADKIGEDFLLSIGRPSYQKNTSFLIEIMNKLVNEYGVKKKLLLVGVGHFSPLKEKIIALINNYKLTDYIFLIDWVPRSVSIEYISSCLLYLSTSRYEGLPYALLEAMSIGKAIVATNVDGNRDAVKNGETGFLVKEGEIIEFATCVKLLIENNKKRRTFEISAQKRFLDNFDIKKNITQLEAIYLNKLLLI